MRLQSFTSYKEDSYLNIEALEDSLLIFIDFEKYKELIEKYSEFKTFYINYLEKNWVIIKKEMISLMMMMQQQDMKICIKIILILKIRIAQASYSKSFGITPTQLSRIRKKSNLQHMQMK